MTDDASDPAGAAAPYPTLTVIISTPDTRAAMAFYAEAFGAVPRGPLLEGPDGVIYHAELAIGDGVLMLSDTAAGGAATPAALGQETARLNLTLDDVDAVWRTAVDAGATVIIPLADQFYGHRSGRLRDPWGHVWVLSQELERLSEAEMRARMAQVLAGDG